MSVSYKGHLMCKRRGDELSKYLPMISKIYAGVRVCLGVGETINLMQNSVSSQIKNVEHCRPSCEAGLSQKNHYSVK